MSYRLSEIEHNYGPQVHILNNPSLSTWLAQLSSPKTFQPQINNFIEYIYRGLVQTVINNEFPKEDVSWQTRMSEMHPGHDLSTQVIKQNQKAVTVNLARAGTYPSQICYNLLNYILEPAAVRQDHILASRTTNKEEKVTGTELGAAKIGGDVDDRIVIFPDPMGATGGTIVHSIDYYKNQIEGTAKKFVALHLIVTPEYLKKVTAAHKDVAIYAVRLDRGLSSPDILKTIPGTHWDQEKGLNDKQYIVPGAGGLGELLNNTEV